MVPTVTTDYTIRVIAFATREEAAAEARAWRKAGARTRTIVRNGVANVLVGA